LPSEQWFPPTNTSSAATRGGTFQATKSQKYWLLKSHPEAFLGNLDLKQTISEQLRAHRSHGDGPESRSGSALAVGEIWDLRKSSHPVPRPAVATAAGEAGHVLRVSMINLKKWTWAKSPLPIGALSQFHGTWSSDGSSINKIQFATKPRQQGPLRWLVAQKSTTTTIFQPEIRTNPIASVARTAILGDADLQHISLKPLVTLTKDATGGDAHSDFSINIGSETDAPQLAIVDMSGNWSVWFIDSQHNQSGGPDVYTFIPKNRGSFENSSSFWSPNRSHISGNQFRISWVCKSRRDGDWGRESTPSDTDGSVFCPQQTDYLTGYVESGQKYDGLLLCDSTRVQILDTAAFDVHSHLVFSRRRGVGNLLAALPIPGCPNNILVLTTEQLYVLDMGISEDQAARKPNVLISCPHFRGADKQTLRMSVARLPSSAEWASSLVLVYSNRSPHVQLFYLTVYSQDGSASFHHQVVQFPDIHPGSGELVGIASLHAVPVRSSAPAGRRHSGRNDSGAHVESYENQILQLFGLGNDLSLSSLVIAITSGSDQWPGRPELSTKSRWDDTRWKTLLRKRVLREATDALVVPDAVEGDKELGGQRVIQNYPKHETIQLRLFLIELMNEINAGFFGVCNSALDGNNDVGPFDTIKETSEKRELHEHIALQPLLRFKDPWHALDLRTLEALWKRDLERLQQLSDIQLFYCSPFGPALEVGDFFERFSINWSSRLAAEALTATQWRYMQLALERMAADVYLSGKCVYIVPQPTLDLVWRTRPRAESSQSTVDDLSEESPLSRAGSEMTLPTPSATPTSSRANSQVAGSFETQEENDDESGGEDPAVARMRMYAPLIKFTPRSKQGQSRIVSLWPEERGSDPDNYKYSRNGKGADELTDGARRRREKREERRRRRAEKRAQLGIKLEDLGESFSQASVPDEIRSSPPSQLFAKSQGQSQGFGFGSESQSQSGSQNHNFGPFQTMSQPLRGEFGTRNSVLRKKIKGRHKATPGLR
jgi:RNA polymerase I-specific transcription initiation factor RRN6